MLKQRSHPPHQLAHKTTLNRVEVYKNPSAITVGRLFGDGYSIILNSVPYVGVGLGLGVSYLNDNGHLDPFYENFGTPFYLIPSNLRNK